MRTFELRVYKLRTKEALDFYMEQIYPRHLSSFPLFGIEPTASGPPRRMSSHGSSCWPPMRRAKNPARSFGGIRKAQNSLRASGTLMYQTLLALNRQSSYLQQAPLLNEVTHSKALFMEEFMMEVLNVVAIIVAGLMVGCEVAIAAFVHPTLDKLPDDVHLPAANALARVLGRFMPFWYILVFLLTLAEVVIQWHQSGRLPIWIATSAVLWMLASLYSITALVPINNRIKSTPPPDWK
jgi:uncharacterized membrane protein